jgi:hypothetical protein
MRKNELLKVRRCWTTELERWPFRESDLKNIQSKLTPEMKNVASRWPKDQRREIDFFRVDQEGWPNWKVYASWPRKKYGKNLTLQKGKNRCEELINSLSLWHLFLLAVTYVTQSGERCKCLLKLMVWFLRERHICSPTIEKNWWSK